VAATHDPFLTLLANALARELDGQDRTDVRVLRERADDLKADRIYVESTGHSVARLVRDMHHRGNADARATLEVAALREAVRELLRYEKGQAVGKDVKGSVALPTLASESCD
jgi:hypothetical protein